MAEEATLLTSEALGTREWKRLYAVYRECLRAHDRGEVLPVDLRDAVADVVAFYKSLGRDRAGASIG